MRNCSIPILRHQRCSSCSLSSFAEVSSGRNRIRYRNSIAGAPTAKVLIRTLAVKVNVGHGTYNHNTASNQSRFQDSEHVEKISVAQIKAAELEFQRMTLSTQRLLSTKRLGSKEGIKSFENEVKVALNYWTSRWITHFHPYFALTSTHVNKGVICGHSHTENEECYGDYGPKQAERVLRWVIDMNKSHPEYNLLNHIFTDLGNSVFGNIIEAYLLPCGTNMTGRERFMDPQSVSNKSFVQLSSLTGTVNVDPRQWIPAMYKAFHMVDLMMQVHHDPGNILQEDIQSKNAELCAYSKLLVLTAHHKHGVINWANELPMAFSLGLPSSFQLKTVEDIIARMEQIVYEMENKYRKSKMELMRPTTITYNHILAAFARGSVPNAASLAQKYLRRMEIMETLTLTDDSQLVGSSNLDGDLSPALALPDSGSYNLAIQALGSELNLGQYYQKDDLVQKKVQIAHEAQTILDRCEARSKVFLRDDCKPNTITYSTVLSYYADAGMACKAEELLKKMMLESDENVQPNLICFNTCINAWAQTKSSQSADNALAILENMFQLTKEINQLQPDTISFSSVIAAFAKSDRLDAGDQAESLLQRSIDLYNAGHEKCKPDSMTYNVVLEALSKQVKMLYMKGHPYGTTMQRAEDFFQKMHTLRSERNLNVRPDNITYNILLDMYGNVQEIEKATALFDRLSHSTSIGPDIISFNSMLYAFANSRERRGMKDALKLIDEMTISSSKSPTGQYRISPDSLSYNIVASGLAKRASEDEDALTDLERLLVLFETRLYDKSDTFIPVNSLYNICIDAWAKSGSPKALEKCQGIFARMTDLSKELDQPALLPNTVTYATLINAIAGSGRPNAPYIAESLLKQMKDVGLSPNLFTFSALVKCWSRSNRPEAASKAVDIIMQMKSIGLAPNSHMFTSVLNCIANSEELDSGIKAEEIMDFMESLDQDSTKPNVYTFTSVLKAWTMSGSPDASQRALELLDRLESSNSSIKPTEACYNAAINTIAKSSSPTKAREAQKVLHRLLANPTVTPSANTYSTVMNACAYTKIDQGNKTDQMIASEAFAISKECFRRILQNHADEINSVVFNTFLQCCRNLLLPGKHRDELVCSVFEECHKRGYVNIQSVVNLRKSLSPSVLKHVLFGSTLENGTIEWKDIPESWRRNAVESKRFERSSHRRR